MVSKDFYGTILYLTVRTVSYQEDHEVGKGEVELMGLFLFAASILSFLPSLVISVLNEASYPMWVGLATLIFYFVLGLIGLICMGDYSVARSHAQQNTTPSNLS
jgi:hypothetical protein